MNVQEERHEKAWSTRIGALLDASDGNPIPGLEEAVSEANLLWQEAWECYDSENPEGAVSCLKSAKRIADSWDVDSGPEVEAILWVKGRKARGLRT